MSLQQSTSQESAFFLICFYSILSLLSYQYSFPLAHIVCFKGFPIWKDFLLKLSVRSMNFTVPWTLGQIPFDRLRGHRCIKVNLHTRVNMLINTVSYTGLLENSSWRFTVISVGFCIDPVGEKNVKSLPEISICLYPEPVTILLWLAELIEHFFFGWQVYPRCVWVDPDKQRPQCTELLWLTFTTGWYLSLLLIFFPPNV